MAPAEMTRRHALEIGITIGLRQPDESLWTNGIKQNALFLAKLLSASPLGHRVVLLNTTDVAITDALPWSLSEFPTMPFDRGSAGLDVVIELGGQVSPAQTDRLRKQGTRLVSYCCGPEYVQNIEAMIFRRPLWSDLYVNPHYDELWIIPQIFDLNRGFLQTLRRCPARRVPFVWDPMALESVVGDYPDAGTYRPHDGPRRLSVIEPNIDVLKFCLYPVLIAEQAYRAAPDDIGYLHVANADALAREGREFTRLMLQLDIVRAQKASFIGRVQTPAFLAEATDIVISHQWGLALNYFYLEVCWQGYPLVHNAEIVADLGYYYPGHDLELGAALLRRAMTEHDRDWQSYTARQRQRIQRFLATDPDLAASYDDLLFDLMERTAARTPRETGA